MNKLLITLCCALCCMTTSAQQFFGKPKPLNDSLYNTLAQTPPMGWNSWNKFGCDVSEDLIKSMADAMVESGMKDAGYKYICSSDSTPVQAATPVRGAPAVVAISSRMPCSMPAGVWTT